jgi:hypothetical protein
MYDNTFYSLPVFICAIPTHHVSPHLVIRVYLHDALVIWRVEIALYLHYWREILEVSC